MASRNPFYVMAGLYLLLDLLALSALALATVGVVPPLPGLAWLRVHLLTIGVVTQAIVGTLPALVATKLGVQPPGPRTMWLLWGLVNASLAVLVVAMPSGMQEAAALGAVGVFAAIVAMIVAAHRQGACPPMRQCAGMRFYIVGPLYFLVGILLALSMLLGWWAPGGFMGLLEAHVHANVWGFTALVVAGVLLDHVPARVGAPLRFPTLVPLTSWLLMAGAFGLVAGPWLAVVPLTMLGLVVYVVGTGLLLANLVVTALAARGWTPNIAHLLVAYLWMLVPVIVAPAVLLSSGQLPSGRIEAAAISGLVTGWLLQIVLGAFAAQVRLRRGLDPSSDGWWFSVAALNLGVLATWLAAFVTYESLASALTAGGYSLIVAGWLPPLLVVLREVLDRSVVPAVSK